jgi:chromosome segregation ATPase
MKRLVRYFLLIAIVVVFSAKLIYAEEQTPTASPIVTPTASQAATPTPLAEVTVTPSIEPTPIPTPIEVSGITDNSLYSDLLSKKKTINTMVAEENQVCANIKDQEAVNSKAVVLINNKMKSYSAPYLKIIDEIKLLLSQIREKRTQNILKSNTNNETLTSEIEMNTNQIASFNRAVKCMRDSIKYISAESTEFSKKVQTTQQQIDKINEEIADLNNKVIEDKLLKNIEWENFCSAMYNKDLAAANTSYQNIIGIKQRIISNFKEILELKQDVEKLLTPLAK